MVYLMLANGFEEMEAVTVVDILRRADIQVKTVSIMDEKQVYGARGMALEADIKFDEGDFNSCAMIILPGGMPGTINLCNFKPLKEVLETFDKRNKPVAAICAAPMVLAQDGIFHEHDATIFPGMEKELIGANYVDEKVVISKNVITSKGPGTAIDFAIAIVKYMRGAETADSVSKEIIYS